jgi:diaminohydroxyphosphoribosylaminopyrimidine deaminase/5-amino-6-(5-phosphoribosylamino)uracil reductase
MKRQAKDPHNQELQDIPWMRKVLQLAKKAKGKTSPNPLVGAVIVNKNNSLISEGFHLKAGTDHAEIVALKKAGKSAKGCTLYVNLEPCCHFGKTPPCTEAIIKAGIKRVVIGCLDPNKKVNGKGVKILEKAGIEVKVGVLKDECVELNKIFFHWIKTGKPWITLKIAATLNGKISFGGKKDKITGEDSHKLVHSLRAEHDAVLTGSGTVIADNPQLTVREIKGKNPLRVILDKRFRCSSNSSIFHQPGITLLFTNKENTKKETQFPKSTKIIHWNGDFAEVLAHLAKLNITSLMIEGGQTINSFVIENSLAQEIQYFVSSSIAFGEDTLSVFSDKKGFQKHYKVKSVKLVGNDVLFTLKTK